VNTCRRRRRKPDATRCAHCYKPISHVGAKVWRATGQRVAIRCLDCRLAFCPRCARLHFAPVDVVRVKVMKAVVNAALKTMRQKCREL